MTQVEGHKVRMMLPAAAVLLLLGPLSSALSTDDVFNRTRECSLSSPEFTKCIKNAIQSIINNFNSEEVDEEDRMDPLLIPEMPFTYGTLPSEMMGITLSDMALNGLSRTAVNGVRANVKDLSALRLEVDVRNPVLFLEGNYTAHLTGTEEPVRSQGSFNVSIIEVKGALVVKGHVVQRDGKDYLQVDRASFKPHISNLKVNLTNEDDPYPELTTMVVSLMNSYWRIVYSEAIPLIEDSLDRIMRVYAEELTSDVPFYEIVSP